MSASPPFNQLFMTTATPDAVMSQLAMIRVPGWDPNITGPYSITWTHSYHDTFIVVLGIILLLTTLIGGLILFVKSKEVLSATAFTEGSATKVMINGSADGFMAGAVSQILMMLPRAV